MYVEVIYLLIGTISLHKTLQPIGLLWSTKLREIQIFTTNLHILPQGGPTEALLPLSLP